ncbi:MAG: T9SS type A sorting domain-containing protein [Bacteroidetes bacterium]|nr:T9SS type A sorting domain-containing protein [Bacteroidota bacterium]
MNNISYVTVTRNNFDIAQYGNTPDNVTNISYGLYLNGCSGYHVEANNFEYGYVGLIVNNSGTDCNKIYRNTFNTLYGNGRISGCVALGTNSNFDIVPNGWGNNGLEFKCNTYDWNEYQVAVIDDATIARQQGTHTNYQSQSKLLAGNQFYNRNPSGDTDFYIDNLGQPDGMPTPVNVKYIYYRHWDNPLTTADDFVKLVHYDPAKVEDDYSSEVTFTESDACPSGLSGSGISPSPGRDIILAVTAGINAITTELRDNTDGGNTVALVDRIQNIKPKDYKTLCADITAMEYVSDAAMLEFMRNGYRGQPNRKAEALTVHSPLSAVCKQELAETWLPKPFRDAVEALQTGISEREQKENEIAALEKQRAELIAELMQSAVRNDSVPGELDSLIDVLVTINDYNVKTILAEVLAGKGRTDESRQQLAELQALVSGFPATKQPEWNDYIALQYLVADLVDQPEQEETIINDNLGFLTTLAESTNKGFVQAQAILVTAGIREFAEDVKLPPALEVPEENTINGYITENLSCGNGPVSGIEVALLDEYMQPVPGVFNAVTDGAGYFGFSPAGLVSLNQDALYYLGTAWGFSLQAHNPQTLAEWMHDENIIMKLTDVNRYWVNSYNGPDSLYSTGTAIDLNGNIYVAGTTRGEQTGDDYAIVKYDPEGRMLWSATYNGYGSYDDRLTAIVVSDNGDCFITGYGRNSSGNNDFVTLKYSSGGILQWASRFDMPSATPCQNYAQGLALDAGGNVFVTGYSYCSSGGFDIVTVAYNPEGHLIWNEIFDGGAYDFAVRIAIDDAEGIYVAGTSNDNYLLLKYSATGTLLWNRTYNYGDKESLQDMKLDGQGNIFITGLSRNVYTEYATVKYSSGGLVQWINRYGTGSGNASPSALSVDKEGNIVVTGSADNDFLTIKYSNSGQQLWTAVWNGESGNTDMTYGLTTNDDNEIFVTGYSNFPLSKSGYIATVKYSADGVLQWSDLYARIHNGQNRGYDLISGPNNNLYVTGFGHNGNNFEMITIKYAECYETAPLKSLMTAQTIIEEQNDESFAGDEKSAAFRLYPNPANGNLELDYRFETGKNGSLLITTLQGQKVAAYSLNGKACHVFINNTGLSEGMYIYCIYEEETIVAKGKLIIRK